MKANKLTKTAFIVSFAVMLIAAVFTLGMPSMVYADNTAAPVETVVSSDFENGSASPWTSNDNCTHEIVESGGSRVLKSTLKQGVTQNRIQREIQVGQGDGFMQEGKWYDISFRAKAEQGTPLYGVAYFYYAEGDSASLFVISESETAINSEWSEISLGFSFAVENGNCNFMFRRPHMDSPASHSVEAAGKSAITSIVLVLYTQRDVWFFDDFAVKTEMTKMRFDNFIIKSDFESQSTEPWQGGSWATHGITADAGAGSGALMAVLSDGSGQNRAQTNLPISSADNTLTEGLWYAIGFMAKADKSATLNIAFTINYTGGNKTIYLADGERLTSEYARFDAGISFELRGNALYATWRRTDMTGTTSYSFALDDDVSLTSVDLIFYSTDASILYFDDITISTKVSVSVEAGRVIEKISDIGNVNANSKTAIDEAFAAYEALEPAKKAEVFNYSELVAAKRSYLLLNGAVAGTFNDSDVAFRFAALSDTHNHNVEKALQTVSSWKGKSLDACVIAGDITEAAEYQGLFHEIPQVKKCFEDNLPSNVDIFLALGNHDSSAGSNAATFYDGLGERFYRKVLDKSYIRETANAHAVIGGYHFIAVESDYEKEVVPADTVKYLKETLEGITSSPDYHGEYIFVVSHVSMANTVAQCSPIDTLTSLVSDYPQVIMLTGHSHHTLYDELNIMQTDFTTIGLGSVSYTPFEKMTYYESKQFGLIDESYDLSVGSIIEVDGSGNVKITRIDFAKGEEIARPWILSAPKADGSHLLTYPQERKTVLAVAPSFKGEPKIDASYSSNNSVTVTFDTATDDSYVEYYKIELFDDGALVPYKSLNSLSGFYLYPQASDMPAEKTVEITDLKRLPAFVKITAYDSVGAHSAAYSAQAHKSVNDTVVTVDALNINSVAMTYAAGDKYEVATDSEFEHKIANSGSLTDYVGSTLYVREKENEFREHSAAASFTITEYNVTFPSSDTYTIYKGDTHEAYFVGALCEFSISLSEAYSDYKVTVKANGAELEKDADGIYGFTVTADTEITVELTAPTPTQPSEEGKGDGNTDSSGEKKNKKGCGGEIGESGAVMVIISAITLFAAVAISIMRTRKRYDK